MPYPTNEDICNMALSKIGQHVITNIMLDSKIEQSCRLFLPIIRQSLLRQYAWNFAIKRVELVKVANQGFGEYEKFTLPDDYLQSASVYYDEDFSCEVSSFKIEGGFIYCESEELFIKYVSDITDPQFWDIDFINCVSIKLAAELDGVLSKGESKQSLLSEFYTMAIPTAHLNDAWENHGGTKNPLDEVFANSFLLAQNRIDI